MCYASIDILIIGLTASALATAILSLLKNYLSLKSKFIKIKFGGIEFELDTSKQEESINSIMRNLTQPKVFISYTLKDKEFAKKLCEDLRKNGINVWFDEYEINVGDALYDQIKKGIEESAYYIVIISNSYLQSKWSMQELEIMRNSEAHKPYTKILPLLIDDVEIPAIIQNKVYADFRTNYDNGLRYLLRKFDISFENVQKRNGTLEKFDFNKIATAIYHSSKNLTNKDYSYAQNLARKVVNILYKLHPNELTVKSDEINKIVEQVIQEDKIFKASGSIVKNRRV